MVGNTVVHQLLKREKEDADKVYLRQPKKGVWKTYTWGEVIKQARKVAQFLKQLGLKPGDKVSIYSKNCAEWFITDFGITLAGMVNVPLFPNQHQESIEFIINHAEIKLVFIGKLDKYKEASGYIPSYMTRVNFNYHKNDAVPYQWKDVQDCEPLQEVVFPKPEDIFTIIYTSGTSGDPKGALYTHQALSNYLECFQKDIQRIADQPFYRLLSYLPLAHVYERLTIEYGSIAIPCSVSFVQSLDKFAKNLAEVDPSIFTAVPRIWGVFQSKIEQNINSGLPKYLLKIPLLSRIVKRKIRKTLGLAECRVCISGAAYLPPGIYHFFKKMGIPIQEGYGQSENFAYGTLSMPRSMKPGCVGVPRYGVEVKMGDNQEILLKSPCLMQGYYKDEEATKNAFTQEGWLRTGDIGKVDEKGRVYIEGRLSENYKNQKGEFIQPSFIEQKFSANDWVENLCLVGRELESNVMVVSLTEEAKNKPQEEIKASLQKTLTATNKALKGYEKISKALVVKESWTPENKFLTPTLKVKRREVEARYRDFILEAVKKPDKVVWC